MRFRPCIDIHNGKVKQIVGSSLRDEGDRAKENYVAELGAEKSGTIDLTFTEDNKGHFLPFG